MLFRSGSILPKVLMAALLLPASATISHDLEAQETRSAFGAFDYDSSTGVDLRELSVAKHDDFEVRDVTYASPKGGRVTAFLVIPRDTKKHGGLIFQHWGMGDRREFLSEAVILAKAGVVSILVDAPWARPAPWKTPREGNIAEPQADRDLYVQTVVDLRRAVDVLLTRTDIDRDRIGFVGHSYGATWGGSLAGVEHRIKTFVLIAGLPSISDFNKSGAAKNDAIIDSLVQDYGADKIRTYKKLLDEIQPVLYIGRASPSSVLMQFAEQDVYISRSAAQRYFDAASAPKEQRWYFASHEVNDPQALIDRVNWLTEKLSLPINVNSVIFREGRDGMISGTLEMISGRP